MVKVGKYRKSLKKGMKRFSGRRQAVARSVSDMTTVKAESYFLLRFNAGSSSVVETGTGFSYITIAQAIGSSYSYTQIYGDYQKYKITGISVRASDVNTEENASFINGAPVVALAFYPNATGVLLGNVPAYNDQKMYIEPNLRIPQTKYWACPNNSFPGQSVGFGVWNNTNSFASQEGQLSFTNTTTTSSTANITILSIRITLYIQFMTKNY